MSRVVADNYPRSISQYVPDMEFAADVMQDNVIVTLGANAAANADGIFALGALDSLLTSADFANTFDGSSTSLTETVGMMDSPYGRNVILFGDAATDSVCTLTGRDYLGQLMVEVFTLNGTTPVPGAKAFKYIDSLDAPAGGGGTVVNAGWGDAQGLPYAATSLLSDTEDGVIASGVLTAAVKTDPQTSTTGDPRGTFTAATALDGLIVSELRYLCNTSDLHGVEHFNNG